MASPSPAPPRAVVHALRGVLLTTSFSVILLAEERRRRLNIARAALDNAKKLHTARVNRNATALAESYNSRREFPIEVVHDFSHAPTNNPLRRRRQRIDSLETELSRPKEIISIENFEATLSGDFDTASTSQTSQRRWDEWDAARKELSRISEINPFTDNGYSIRFSPDVKLSALQSRTRKPRTQRPATRPNTKPNVKATGSQHANAALNGQLKSILQLDFIVTELETLDLSNSLRAEKERNAVGLLEELSSKQAEEPKEILSRGIRLLQSIATSCEYNNIPSVLGALRPICKDASLLAVPFFDSLKQNHNAEGVRQFLTSLSSFQPESIGTKNDNEWIMRLLMHNWRKTKDFADIQNIYGLLQEGGLFEDDVFPVSTQYAVRRRVILIALDAGDDATASAEMALLSNMRFGTSGIDVKLCGRFIVRDAELGRWDEAVSELQNFGSKAKESAQFQKVLSWLTKTYCKDHTPSQVDIFVRDLVDNHGMTLNKPLASLVMDKHGRTRNIQALVAWVQFCQDGGLEMDQVFFNEIADKCCKYWSLSRIDVVRMLKDVRSSKSWIQDPLLTRYVSDGALHSLHKPLPGERADAFGLAQTLPERRGDSITIYERAVFKHMNTLALRNDWSGTYSAYLEATKEGLGDSSRCLRLAVVANIHLEGPHSCTGSRLINEAHNKKHDIGGALVPMLIARLEAGDNAGELLHENLLKGQKIHDSVYNKAARVLTQKGNPEAAIMVCEVAARENGMGELAYNQYNFASLIHTYTGQGRYTDLLPLINSFISKSEWWHGSKECKESIKFAMKHVASRAARDRKHEGSYEQVLLRLEGALEHIKYLRAMNRQDRETLTKEVISAFKSIDEPAAFEGGFFPDTQAGRQPPKDKRNTDWESSTRRDSATQTTSETRHRIVEDDLHSQNQTIDDVRT
ncbi:hypothetical protein FVEN_g7371 [Fusarium venenatum]|uniref:Uncharacterized protein n=1 Tax=Fusarium venenatum TaxID=56646 RepID=A0A2L2U452_9HYPO|nr:uncharacterized protein FVRRES_09832 [Fusarium venenatum]KAG8354946.1 hypothetical protein FVEN_g7371 [Fusarium venenatum]KAH6966482.1 hypothetical protein EDB82DRAFT_516012 [Fusarium venenatum]CEI69755.1 unnamed protein product [Fusarium venenatum]